MGGEYLTGLMIAERKSVSGINREFAETTDQSCWNRILTDADWDVAELNQQRLEWMQESSDTRYSSQGVIAVDDVLIDHDGQFIQDVGWFGDHAEQRNKIAHDDLIANYVCTSGKHYPLEFRRFKKRDQCEATGEALEDHTVLFCQWVDGVCERNIPGDFTFDSDFSNAENLNHIHSKQNATGRARGDVGDLKTNRKREWKGRTLKATELAAEIPFEDRQELRRGDTRQYYFTCTVRIPNVNHKVRIVIIWKHKRDAEPCQVLVSNRIHWEVSRIRGVYRYRWTGAETFHRDGQQELGRGDCQLRDGQGQTRHMYLVMLAYSLLVRQLGQNRAQDWALQKLTTIGEACRAMLRETLRTTLAWAIQPVTEKESSDEHVITKLGLA